MPGEKHVAVISSDRSSDNTPTLAASSTDSSPARISPSEFLSIAIQLGLVLVAYLMFNIETERGFGVVAALTMGGFIVHSWLPFRLRIPFFVFLTLLAIAILLRADGIFLVILGLALLALCHVPLPWWGRVVLVLIAGTGIAALRGSNAPWVATIIPILAAMFMFRLIIYLYDLKNDNTPASCWQRVAYFFMLPNVCFPLFPVVDYKTFLRTYYDSPAGQIYQKGVSWMFRGLAHLLLYRILYQALPGAETDLSGVLGVYVFMAMTYALYLRVSGLFHLITGSLALFGFNLPRTNLHYFLASSFTDLWRRINIYWKDFMMGIVFYPAFMAVRGWPMSRRLVFGTAAVFLVTWFLHSYQWFWLEGSFPLTGADIAFWGLLGVALAVNSVFEARFGRRRVPQQQWVLREALTRALKTWGVFSTMAVLWSLWSSGSFSEWGYRLLRIRESSLADWIGFLLFVASVLLLGIVVQWLNFRRWGLNRFQTLRTTYTSRLVPAGALVVSLVGLPSVYEKLGDQIPRVIVSAKSPEPNQIDQERQERSYYEVLSRTTELGPTTGFWVSFHFSPGAQRTGDLRGITIAPNVEMRHNGASFHSNRWGMRDRDYEMKKPASTRRLAILGSSHAVGSGVDDAETFENVMEDQFNRDSSRRSRYEVLNFAVPGYGLLQVTHVAENKLPAFQPDIVLYFVLAGEAKRTIQRIQWALQLGGRIGSDYQYVEDLVKQADAKADLPAGEFEHRLLPYSDDLVRWAYRRQVDAIRFMGAKPVFVFLPGVGWNFRRDELNRLRQSAEEAGALTISLSDVYQGRDPRKLRVSEWDHHPNAEAHALIAESLYDSLVDHEAELGLVDTPPFRSRESAIRRPHSNER